VVKVEVAHHAASAKVRMFASGPALRVQDRESGIEQQRLVEPAT
jgi:hypothetical protein